MNSVTALENGGLLQELRAILRVVKEFNAQVEAEFDTNIN